MTGLPVCIASVSAHSLLPDRDGPVTKMRRAVDFVVSVITSVQPSINNKYYGELNWLFPFLIPKNEGLFVSTIE
jgi:hypothetical protein